LYRIIYAVEVAGQSGLLVSNLDGKHRRIIERTTSFVGFNGFLLRAKYTRIVRIVVEEELGGTKIGCGSQIAVSCAHAMARVSLSFSLAEDPRSCGVPLFVLTVGIAGDDAVDGRHQVTELAGAVAARPECALRFLPELNLVRANEGL
jgi:hypothetical protein